MTLNFHKKPQRDFVFHFFLIFIIPYLFIFFCSLFLFSARRCARNCVLAYRELRACTYCKRVLSILSVSRIEVAENRKSVNELLNAFAELHEDFSNVTIVFNERIFNLDRHVAMNSIIEGLSRLATEARLYIEHLQMQLNSVDL